MNNSLPVIILCISLAGQVDAQTFADSNLPIVIISTDGGVGIPDDPRVHASMKIIYRGPGQRNYVADQDNPAYLNYDGRIEIETRGSSTQVPEKKQYGFTTLQSDNMSKNNVSLLGMPDENDWVLNGMAFDPALMREYLTFNLYRMMGEYASRTAYCEVMINGDYKGLYCLQEKLKADNNRVDILKIGFSDNSDPEISGGYISKADKTTQEEPIAWLMSTRDGTPVGYLHEFPKPENATQFQTNYIRSQFELLESTARTNNAFPADGFPSHMDMPSFIHFMLINELASNVDAYMYSTFFHKDRNGKLRAGPIWDLDLTYGNDLYFWGLDRSKPDVWQFANGDNEGSRFWYDLFGNSVYKCYLSKRWSELIQPAGPLNIASLEAYIDQIADTIGEAVQRNNHRWWIYTDHQQQVTDMKSFLHERINWMSSNLGSHQLCSDVPVPPLVITRIMYHPATSIDFPDEDDLEFMEILNNGDLPVDLTGIYFGGTGLVYRFPVDAVLGPHSTVVLASNSSVFQAKYGCAASDHYTRQLSNKGENLVLLDAFGNMIDHVFYGDTIPWPEADGNGYYLRLLSPDLDNSLAENWTASNEIITSDLTITEDLSFRLYPNPVKDFLRIQAGSEISLVRVLDMQGRLLVSIPIGRDRYDLDLSRLARGTYVIKIITVEKAYSGKIVKE